MALFPLHTHSMHMYAENHRVKHADYAGSVCANSRSIIRTSSSTVTI